MAESVDEFLRGVIANVDASATHVSSLEQEYDVETGIGFARGTAEFTNQAILRFTVVARLDGARVTVVKYAFHVADRRKQTVLRYDDSSHHSDVATHPHHKHVGPNETVEASGPVTVEQVIEEIRTHLAA